MLTSCCCSPQAGCCRSKPAAVCGPCLALLYGQRQSGSSGGGSSSRWDSCSFGALALCPRPAGHRQVLLLLLPVLRLLLLCVVLLLLQVATQLLRLLLVLLLQVTAELLQSCCVRLALRCLDRSTGALAHSLSSAGNLGSH